MKKRRILSKVYMGVILVLMYMPILIVIVYSFNESRISSVWRGFTFNWYDELFKDKAMWTSLRNSVILALLSSFAAAVIGTLGASGAARLRLTLKSGLSFRLQRIVEYLSILPIMIPEIILGMIFLAFFSLLGLPFGMLTLVIAHTAFCIPYVYLLVRARLAGLDKTYTEAARVLGAGGMRAFYDITLPLLMPAVISGMLLSFAMSFDDVIISVFVTGVNTNTLPVKIYSQLKTGVTPKTNALCTLLFAVTVVLCLGSAYFGRMKHGEKNPERRAALSNL
ncbi:MAG: ABC transporter permease [Treponema sp.]|jgi:spermidine/putrescine transport system permease protein|nr:ABC transporter permease [Treponema sp.]